MVFGGLLAAGAVAWGLNRTIAISFLAIGVTSSLLFGWIALEAFIGRGTALVVAEDGVRWRKPWSRRLLFLPWGRIALARLETYTVRSAVQQRLYLKLRPTGHAALIAEPMVVLNDLDASPAAVLEALAPYVFVQDDR